jgi:hypothetical protein
MKATKLTILSCVIALTTALAATIFVGPKSDGYHIGMRTTDLVGFFGAKPVTQQASTTTTRAALENLGLVAAGSYGTAAATSGAATLNTLSGTITSEALTTAAGAAYTLTLTNSTITTSSVITASVDQGTNTTAGLEVGRITPANGSVTILVWNRHASAALNGTIKISFK